MQSIVDENGQVTIPKMLRDRLGITPHTRLEFHKEDGALVARKVSVADPVAEAMGCLELDRPSDEILSELRGRA